MMNYIYVTLLLLYQWWKKINLFYSIFNYLSTCCLYGAGRNDFDGDKSIQGPLHGRSRPWKSILFWALKWQLAKQVQFGPQKVDTGNFMYMSFAAVVFCILFSVFCTICCEFYVIFRAHPFQWPSLSLPHRDKVNSLRPGGGGKEKGGGPPPPSVHKNLCWFHIWV